ncbi:MAG TPA: DUF4159 domain-containing protein, partial [Humisphaera sp.]
ARTVVSQRPDGSWGCAAPPAWNIDPNAPSADVVTDTAFCTLFLSAGRHPVLMNKLRHPGAWDARPRDVANATRHAARAAGRPLSWRVATLDRAGADWLDAPVLYVATDQAIPFADADVAGLRRYVECGGLLFVHCDGGSGTANRFAADLAAKLFPRYPLQKLPADHPLYAAAPGLRPEAVPLKAVSNGSRVLVLVSTDDVAANWQAGAQVGAPEPRQLAANLHAYVAGGTVLRPRLQGYDVPAPKAAPVATIAVARLKWAGNWDPEPGAWARAGRFMQWETGATVDARPTAAADLKPGAAPVAHLTGTGPLKLSDADAAAVRAYVEAGGVLLVDACGGDPVFARSAEAALVAAMPGLALSDADRSQAPFAAAFDVMDDLTGPPGVRAPGAAKVGGAGGVPRVRVGRLGGGAVVFSPLDLSTGMAGSNALGVIGFTPDYAVGLAKNVVVWAAARRQPTP